jgi:hypothetical protein
MRRAALLLLAGLALGCASAGGIPEPEGGSVAVSADTALSLHQGTEDFYNRLIQRRVNTLETFNDPVLRKFFRSQDLFFDYYAELAQSLADAHFEKSRPFAIEVQEMVFEDPARAQVQVLFRGFDDRPLRPNRVSLVRRDQWHFEQESWWINPGKL